MHNWQTWLIKEKVPSPRQKSAQKKAKRAASKARQDLAGVFATKSVRDAIKLSLDKVDESPVSIPKKFEVVPVASLALPFPTAKDTQERLENPPKHRNHPEPVLCPLLLQ